MKARIVFGLLCLTLAVALVFGGLTLAWFTDETAPPVKPTMTTGTIDYEITKAQFEPEAVAWSPGECKNFTWTLENTGTKSIFYRARLIETISQEETAWGKGIDFPGANWAMYFEYNGVTKEVPLLASKDYYEAGTVEAGVDDKGFYVTYKTTGDWRIAATHLLVTNTLTDGAIPQVANGNPAPGQFPYKGEHGIVEEYTYRPDIDLDETIYIAAHAEVVSLSEAVPADGLKGSLTWGLTPGLEGAWQQGEPEDLNGENVYWWYNCARVGAGEEITFNLTACLDEEAQSGIYTVQLEVEAVQTTHDAVNEIWPNNPCNQNQDS